MRTILGKPLNLDWRIATLTVTSTLMIIIDSYHNFTPWKYVDRTLIYLAIPLLITVFIFRQAPRAYGFQFGEWRTGLLLTLAGIVVMTPIIWFLGHNNPAMHAYYKPYLTSNLVLYTFLDLIGWEFIFRGWLLFGYGRKFGAEAIWLQAVPFAIAHIGKPEIETLSTIFGGFAFGWIAWRTRSFLYPFLIHWYIATLVIVVAGAGS